MLTEHGSDNNNRHKRQNRVHIHVMVLKSIHHLPTVWSHGANVSTWYRTRNLVKLTESKVIQCRNINQLTTH